jgi:hypothetical protein
MDGVQLEVLEVKNGLFSLNFLHPAFEDLLELKL